MGECPKVIAGRENSADCWASQGQLAERFRRRRMDLGLAQAGLADRLGRTTRAVADWESGATKPLASSWGAIARVLGVDMLPQGPEIGPPLRTAQFRFGLAQAELAAHIGLDPRTIRNTERGRYRPSRATLAKLVSVLTGGDNESWPEPTLRVRGRAMR